MGLRRAWGRELLTAASAAVLAPTAVIAAIGALALAGGFGGIGRIGQLFSGPALAPLPAGTGAFDRADLAPRARNAVAGGARVPALTVASRRLVASARARSARGSGGPEGSAGRGSSVGPPPRVVSPPAPGVPPAGGTPSMPPVPPAPAPPRRPTLVDGAVSAATKLTSRLPGPAGPAATQGLQTGGSTVDQVLGKLQPAPDLP